jgi:hypothetical protein
MPIAAKRKKTAARTLKRATAVKNAPAERNKSLVYFSSLLMFPLFNHKALHFI